jgi:hypothetical protein
VGLLHAIKTRGPLWVTVHSLLYIFDRYVELVLYPRAIGSYGLAEGIGVMIVFSLVVCWALLLFYDWVSTIDVSNIENKWLRILVIAASDALGFESLKETGVAFGEKLNKLLPRAWEPVRKYLATPAFFLGTSLCFDGMTCTILMRPARQHHMTFGYWMLFTASVILSCLGWGLIVGLIVHLLQANMPGLWNVIERILSFLTGGIGH